MTDTKLSIKKIILIQIPFMVIIVVLNVWSLQNGNSSIIPTLFTAITTLLGLLIGEIQIALAVATLPLPSQQDKVVKQQKTVSLKQTKKEIALKDAATPLLPQQDKVVKQQKTVLLKRTKKEIALFIALAFISIIEMLPTCYVVFYSAEYAPARCNPYPILAVGKVLNGLNRNADGMSSFRLGDGECIGISNGNFAFDTLRPDGSLKLKAAMEMREGNTTASIQDWKNAYTLESDDAEAHIYEADQNIIAGPHPYLDIIVVTLLSGSSNSVHIGRDNLQGAYIAQKEFNDNKKNDTKIRLLLANAGDASQYSSQIAQQIQQEATQDDNQHFIGVMGWPESAEAAIQAIQYIGKLDIVQVSPSASTDVLSDINNPYFYRIIPSNKEQAAKGANYAKENLDVSRILLIEDNDTHDDYSQNLAQDFIISMNTQCDDEQPHCHTVLYNKKDPANFAKSINANIQTFQPTMIYFAGYADEATVLFNTLQNLVVHTHINTIPPVLGGDALYQLRSSFFDMYLPATNGVLKFTAFAYPDDIPHSSHLPNEYSQAFGADAIEHSSPYGFLRPDNDAILSYDALQVLLTSVTVLLKPHHPSISSQTINNFLQNVNAKSAFQGASGNIYFKSDTSNNLSDAKNKPIIVICVSPSGKGADCTKASKKVPIIH